jgi:hypothetical protein
MHYTYSFLVKKIKYSKSHSENLLRVLAYVDPDGSRDLSNWELVQYVKDHGEYDGSGEKCVCSHTIRWENRVRHKTTLDTLEIGNVCIQKFFPDMKHRAKRLIDLHRNPQNKYCSSCDTKVRESVVEQFPNQLEFYHITCLKAEFEKCDIYKYVDGTQVNLGCGGYIGYNCSCRFVKCSDCDKMMRDPEHWRIRCGSCYYDWKDLSQKEKDEIKQKRERERLAQSDPAYRAYRESGLPSIIFWKEHGKTKWKYEAK